MVEVYSSFTPLTDDDIVKFEKLVGFRLPEEYRIFFLKHNGGFIHPDSFYYAGSDNRKKVGCSNRFYSITGNQQSDSMSLYWAWKIYKNYREDDFPGRFFR